MTGSSVSFSTKSGLLIVSRRGDTLELDMRAAKLTETGEPDLCVALGIGDSPVWLADGHNDAAIIEVADEATVRSLTPDFAALGQLREWQSSPLVATARTSRAACSCPTSASTKTR